MESRARRSRPREEIGFGSLPRGGVLADVDRELDVAVRDQLVVIVEGAALLFSRRPLVVLLAVLQAATAASVITVTTTGICRFFMK